MFDIALVNYAGRSRGLSGYRPPAGNNVCCLLSVVLILFYVFVVLSNTAYFPVEIKDIIIVTVSAYLLRCRPWFD